MHYSKYLLMVGIGAFSLVGCTDEAKTNSTDAIIANNAAGEIFLPQDFDRWPTLGSWATASAGPETPVDEMHTVYVSPGGIESYNENGVFADGTVLIKEVRGAKPSQLTTGNAHWPTDTKVWFVMVKDAAGTHQGNPLWQEGWGWGLFEAGDQTKQVATSFAENCQTCHEPAKDSDWIYSAAYPVIRGEVPKKVSWDND
ncbi:cytochrome P460 family protein [Qipengyuania sp. ASV99]|uniref:cytochrome P460 family protein n=1 Tax=Qipengyuania sp. ASV99 TaxID=3399681 RepID=UPI003A4C67AD